MNMTSAEKSGVRYNVHETTSTCAPPTSLGGMLARKAPSMQAEGHECWEVLVLPLWLVCARSCELDVGMPMAATVRPRPRKRRPSRRMDKHDRKVGERNES